MTNLEPLHTGSKAPRHLTVPEFGRLVAAALVADDVLRTARGQRARELGARQFAFACWPQSPVGRAVALDYAAQAGLSPATIEGLWREAARRDLSSVAA